MAGSPNFPTPSMLNSLFVASLLGVSVGFQPAVSTQLLSPETGQLKLQTGILSEPLQGLLTQAAEGWVLARREELGLGARSTLRLVQAHGTWFGASIRFQQQVDGI